MARLTADSPSVHTHQTAIAGRNVIISGGTSGNGRAIAALLAAEGANVFIFGRDEAKLRRTLDELQDASGKVAGITADQARPEDVRRVFEAADREIGPVDVLINNAGVWAGSIVELGEDEWRDALHTDLDGYIDCTRHAVQRMKRRGGGHIVNIGSISAAKQTKGSSLYVAAKSAIEGMSISLRRELGEHNVKVTVIEPGRIGTDIFDETDEESDPQVQREREARGELLKAGDIAVAVHYCITQPARCTIGLMRIHPAHADS